MSAKLWISISVSALLWCAALSAPALAQAPAVDEAAGTGQPSEEVVVTAERRTRNLQTTPIAADVLSGNELAKRGVVTIEQLQFATPSLTVQNSGQGNSFNIRGIGKTENNSSVGVGVITYRDGVAVFPAYFQNEPLFDIQSVEVLRGPQGTFAGQNATGGAVFVTQRKPTLDEVGGYLTAQYGNYNDIRLQGAIDLPLGETLALRVAFNGENRDSFFRVIQGTPTTGGTPGDLKNRSVRATLLWTPTDALTITASADYSSIDLGGYPTSPYNSLDELFDIRTNGPYDAKDETLRTVLNIGYEFESGIKLNSISSYQYGNTEVQADSDGTATGLGLASNATFRDDVNQTLWSQEVNLVSPDDQRLRWVVGAYYQSDLIRFPPGRFVTFNGLFNITLQGRNPKTTEAAFAQISYDLTDQLELQVGARYTHSVVVNDAISAIPGVISLSQNERREEDAVTGKIALNYKVNADHFVYAFVARGHKAGGLNGVNTSFVPPDPFDSEEVTDFEIGWKADWLDGQLKTQLGGYYNIYENFQISLGDPVFTTFNEIVNVTGNTHIYGIEATAQARFGELGLDVGLSLAHSELPDYFAADSRRARTGACNPTTGPGTGNCVNVGGNAQTYSPEVTFRFGIEYDIAVGNGTLTPRLDYSHISETWTTIFANPALGDRLAARDIFNAQLTYAYEDWQVQAYSTNLTDERYVASIKSGQRYAAPPAQYGIRVTRSF
ncbi:Vitamin B12 transporter BtuB [Alphaproteobacteria bacterium SO-S41]|nr:Vitamin B12 transporter BtuB [Alphaproteobacteria bacterium SO-S41]